MIIHLKYCLLFLVIFLLSCSNNKSDKTSNTLDSTKSDTKNPTLKLDNLTSEATIIKSGVPLTCFLQFADTFTKLGWISDTTRVEKHNSNGSLKRTNVHLFDNKPFYKMDINEHQMFQWKNLEHPLSDSLDYDLFKKAKSIWGFYYHKDIKAKWIPDGVIEQWEFPDTNDVNLAYRNLMKIYPIPYFNTRPYYFKMGNYLFIFSSGAMLFSYEQESVFKLFKKLNSTRPKI